jgi:hypothetical protein
MLGGDHRICSKLELGSWEKYQILMFLFMERISTLKAAATGPGQVDKNRRGGYPRIAMVQRDPMLILRLYSIYRGPLSQDPGSDSEHTPRSPPNISVYNEHMAM